MKKWILVILLGLNATVTAQTNRAVFPDGFESQNGNAAAAIFSGNIPEFQQLFRATALQNDWHVPVQITGIAFRVTEGASSFSSVVPRVEIRLSTSSRAPEQMTSGYSQNRGVDETTVFLHNDVSLFATGGQPINPFDLVFRFDVPFTYDPNAGNLLLYIANSGGSPGFRSLDSHFFSDLTTSPVAGFGAGFGAPNAYGLIAEFHWTVVPEPSVAALGIVGALFICLRIYTQKY